MTPRATLSRILAVNWYGYRQFIDVRGLTLITGANGSGKSALLDLIQFVMLGEQTSRFNKAAAGAGSGRTLRGYCLCDTNTVGRDGQERYLRPSGVTLAGLEFAWPEAADGSVRRETWGARIEYDSPTAKPKTAWFCVPRRVEEEDFLTSGGGDGGTVAFLPEDEFRVRWKRDVGAEIWDRQATYLDEMALRAHLGFGRTEMNKTLPSAMAFQPVENFEKFIRDFLLEPSLPDVKAVKASVDAHRRAQERLEKMSGQLERLTKIAVHHGMEQQARKDSGLWSYLREALAHAEVADGVRVREEKLEKLQSDHAANREAKEAAIVERNALQGLLEEVQREVFKDDGASRLDETKQKLAGARTDLKQLRTLHQNARDFLHGRTQYWQQWLRHGENLGVAYPAEAEPDLTVLRGTDTGAALDASSRLARTADGLLAQGAEEVRVLSGAIKTLEAREKQLSEDLAHYREGRAAASPLLDALRAKGQRAVALGRVVEVTAAGEKWWPLLESLLAQDRQAILPEDFAAAWETAQRVASAEEPLLHPDELAVLTTGAGQGSLRQFLETAHSGASAWLDVRLGDVMPVKHVRDLERYPRALSADGWLKDPPRRERLVPAKELTLGENGLRRLRETREVELEELVTELTAQRRRREDWNAWLHKGRDWQLNDFAVPPGSNDLRRLAEAEREVDMLEETLKLLATPEREAAVSRMRQLQNEGNGQVERAARLDERVTRAEQEMRGLTDALGTMREQEKSLMIACQESRVRVTGVSESEVTTRLEAALAQPGTWRQRMDQAAELARQRLAEAEGHQRRRDEERRAMLEAHPELGDAFDIGDASNDRYDQRRRELEEQELPRFREEAEKARREWEERLQHQVLDVIREKLAEAERTKRELNRAMDCEIGGWRYQIRSTTDRSHTAIWALVDKGLPSGEDMGLFNAAASEEIERAKAELMAAIEAAEEGGDTRAQRALDYRYYHHWRMMAHHAGRGDEAAADLDKIAKKQSGGENQAPFFVATLAAFRRVYDQGQRSPQVNLGLVVMDEAFSKLSGDRIDDCLALARNFGLQLIMAFPEDRLPTMAAHADTIVQCRVERTWERDTITGIENWVIRVDRDRLQEILT